MLDKEKLIRSFEEIIGWPYESPGTNDKNGIDCSGAFVSAYQAQGASIYHGSNRIIRAHCRGQFVITDASQLHPGMAVFKVRNDGEESSDYKPGGRYYDPLVTGNFYHIGLITGNNPMRIVHATTPAAKADASTLGASGTPWSWAAYLTDVDYGEPPLPEDGGSFPYDAVVDVGESDRGLNFRPEPRADAGRIASCKEIPNGAALTVLADLYAISGDEVDQCRDYMRTMDAMFSGLKAVKP